jgi:hypothetical protein
MRAMPVRGLDGQPMDPDEVVALAQRSRDRKRRDELQDRIDKTLARSDRLLGKYAAERQEKRDVAMLRWTKAAAVLGGIAALAAIATLWLSLPRP